MTEDANNTNVAGDEGADSEEQEESERMRVLRMLSEGKISPAEAEDLLHALEPDPPPHDVTFTTRVAPPGSNWFYGPAGVVAGAWGAARQKRRGPDVFFRWDRPGVPPPVPPMPPMPPVPPTPAVAPFPPHAPFPNMPFTRVKADARAVRKLVIYSKLGDSEVTARIPLSLAGNAERFLPKQVKKHLADCEIEIDQLLQGLASIAPDADVSDELLHLEEGDSEIRIHVE